MTILFHTICKQLLPFTLMMLAQCSSLFQEFTFTLTGSDGKKLHGFCRSVFTASQNCCVLWPFISILQQSSRDGVLERLPSCLVGDDLSIEDCCLQTMHKLPYLLQVRL